MVKGYWLILGTLLGVVMLASCQPDTMCRQEMDVNCTVCAMDSNHAVKYRAYTPLRIDTTQTVVSMLNPIDSTNVLLFIDHSNETRYVSMACGCMVSHIIDTVWINCPSAKVERVNDVVTSAKEDHIRVVFY